MEATESQARGHARGGRTGQVLVIDSDCRGMKALVAALAPEDYPVLTAGNGPEALEIIGREDLAVIISAVELPGMTGIEVLKAACAMKPQAVRILLTTDDQLDVIIKAVNIAQVSQCVPKPWDDHLLRQVVRDAVQRYALVRENENLQKLIYAQHQELALTHENLRHELRIGAQIHEVLLMGNAPNDLDGLTIEAMTVPSKDIDGDFYDFYKATPQLCDLVIGDVMGKGIPAALVGTAVKTQLVRFALPPNKSFRTTGRGVWEEDLLPPDAIIDRVHNAITPQLLELGYFVSLFYGRFDIQRKSFRYVDCGCVKPLHYSAKDTTIRSLKGKNFPLGMVEDDDYIAVEVPYNTGDIFIFYSDGITEAKSPDGELFGVERLAQVLENCVDSSPPQILATIEKSVQEFTQRHAFDDDLTCIVIKTSQPTAPSTLARRSAKFSSDLSQLPAVRNFIEQLCRHIPGAAERFGAELQLAINESFCNIVKHSYQGKAGSDILITGEARPDGLAIALADKGCGFNPIEAAAPSLAGDRCGGYGLYIIKEIADELNYRAKDGPDSWNRLEIFKRYRAVEEAMNLVHNVENDVLVVRLESPHIDANDAISFKDRILDIIADKNTFNVVLDLVRVEFVDSSGLGSLLSVLRFVNSKEGDLKIANVSNSVRAIFEIVRMHKLFEIFNSLEDAIRSFPETTTPQTPG